MKLEREKRDTQLNRDTDTYIRESDTIEYDFIFLPVSPHRSGVIMSTLSTFNNTGDLCKILFSETHPRSDT